MSHTIRDLRNNPEAVKERNAEELAHDLSMFGGLYNIYRIGNKPGAVIKELIEHGKDFSGIKSNHAKNERVK